MEILQTNDSHSEAGEYQGKRVIWIRFPYSEALKSYLRANTNAWREKLITG